jgi:hypothetical protein
MNQRAIDVGEAVVRHEEALSEYLRLMGELGAEEARMRDLLSALQSVGIKPASGRPVMPVLRSAEELKALVTQIDEAAARKDAAVKVMKALGLNPL